MTAFVKEDRYAVIKRKHLTDAQIKALDDLLRTFDLPPIECVVVEADWPEYQTVWDSIKERSV